MKLKTIFIFLVLSFITFSTNVFAQTTINLITTNDMHGTLENSDTAIGVSQAAAIKNSIPNSLLIDSGDATQGTSLATINKGADVIRLMNAAGYDLMVAGNHEFDYGSSQLLSNADAANFPILSANAITSTGPFLPAYEIKEIAGKTIGFIGITTSTANSSTNPNLRPGVTFADEIETARKYIGLIQNNVDAIVLLTHLGNDQSAVPVTSIDLLDNLSDLELEKVVAVLDGHSHTIEDTPYTRNELSIPIIQDEVSFTHIGKVTINFNDDNTITATEEVMDYSTGMAYPLTQEGIQAKNYTESVVEIVNEEQERITDQVIGATSNPLWGGYIYWDYAEPRIVETNLGDFVSDVFMNTALNYKLNNNLNNEVLGIVNGGGLSGTFDPGDITVKDILNNFNHGNLAVVLEVTPNELFKVIESGLVTTGQSDTGLLLRENVSGSFIQPSGFSYSYDPSAEVGYKVTKIVTDNGTILNRNDTTTKLLVGTQNYVESFFDNAKEVYAQGDESDAIIDYIASLNSLIDYPTNGNRISITNDKSPDYYSVKIPVYNYADFGSEDAQTQKNVVVNISIDGNPIKTYISNESGYIDITLSKGPHTLYASDSYLPVYVNNYSGAGIEYTTPGYYYLAFYIDYNYANAEISLNQENIFLATGENAISSLMLTAQITPLIPELSINWTTANPNVATVTGNNKTAIVYAIADGKTTIYATLSNGKVASANVTVSSEDVVVDDIIITSNGPDYFTVTAVNPHPNYATGVSGEIKKISIFCWSEKDMSDINAKVAIDENNNYSYTIPINNTPRNNYFINAQNINIHVYGSLSESSNGNLIGTTTYNWINSSLTTDYNVCYIAYSQNIGFNDPAVFDGVLSGKIDDTKSKHLEGLRVASCLEGIEISTTVHCQNIGWIETAQQGTYAGTMWQDRQIESVILDKTGENADLYNLSYRVYQRNYGWTEWITSGNEAGRTGMNLPLEAIEIQMTPVN